MAWDGNQILSGSAPRHYNPTFLHFLRAQGSTSPCRRRLFPTSTRHRLHLSRRLRISSPPKDPQCISGAYVCASAAVIAATRRSKPGGAVWTGSAITSRKLLPPKEV